MGLPETGAVPDWCHSSLSITNFVLCEPEKKNYPLIKTLVSRLTYKNQTGNLSKSKVEIQSEKAVLAFNTLIYTNLP